MRNEGGGDGNRKKRMTMKREASIEGVKTNETKLRQTQPKNTNKKNLSKKKGRGGE